MKNIFKISMSALLCTAFLGAPASAEFSDAGTDYTKATVDKWSDDAINDFVSKANSFACVISKARPDVLPNASFEVLMSEVECGLADEEINASGLSNKDTLSKSVMRTARASDTADQTGQFWFNSMDDMKFVGAMNISESTVSYPPYGEWNLSYINNSWDNLTTTAGDEFNNATTPIKGYVDIAVATAAQGGGIIMSSHETNDLTKLSGATQTLMCGGATNCLENSTMVSKIQYYDTSLASSRILGQMSGTDFAGNAFDRITAAKTNATHFYRAVFPSGIGSTPTGQCMKRNSTWKTVHRYGVYNKSTGKKVSLTGGFGYDYTDGSTATRGFISLNGAWFDNPAVAFTAAAPTKAVTAQNEAKTPYTLSWAPGKLSKKVAVVEALKASGPNYFTAWVDNGGEVDVIITNNGGTYEAKYYTMGTATQIANPFTASVGDDSSSPIIASEINSNKWLGWMNSPEKRTQIYWAGGASISFYDETNMSADATLLGKTNGAGNTGYTTLYAVENRAIADATKFPVVAATWVASTTDAYDYGRVASSADTRFYFTALNPPAGKLARTLYLDVNPAGPDAGDKAIMFNFSANERSKEYTSFAATPVTATLNKGGTTEIQWPYKSLELRDTALASDANPTFYKWRTGAFGWDNSVVALKADGTVYTMSEPMILNYVHAASKDMNENKEIVFVKENGNNHNPVPALCTVPDGTRHYPTTTTDVVVCSVEPTDFGTKTYKLRYNGKWVSGLPDMEGRNSENDRNGFRVTMVNPKAGTVVTNVDAAGVTTNYVLKPLAVAEAFLAELPAAVSSVDGDGKFCDDIDFTTVAQFGWSMSDLPSATLIPLPSQTWASQPAPALLKCSVDNGDASACQ